MRRADAPRIETGNFPPGYIVYLSLFRHSAQEIFTRLSCERKNQLSNFTSRMVELFLFLFLFFNVRNSLTTSVLNKIHIRDGTSCKMAINLDVGALEIILK